MIIFALKIHISFQGMGGVISSDTSVEGNSFLKRFSSLQPISDNDPFWNHFLSFNLRIDLYDKFVFNEIFIALLELLNYRYFHCSILFFIYSNII